MIQAHPLDRPEPGKNRKESERIGKNRKESERIGKKIATSDHTAQGEPEPRPERARAVGSDPGGIATVRFLRRVADQTSRTLQIARAGAVGSDVPPPADPPDGCWGSSRSTPVGSTR
eukprot:1195450-Prorocentrum_minimum.AAC.1